ncbi:IMPACT family member YigZ [Achromobacter anxifer]|uniref:IMPACT family member YigZ n=1 Tax=Achromobacter anxifer TaxID=1287737 RepID=A0A6S7DQA1_9BURK|nr:YigZ family protein [Achromobacter anxifer]CAB3829915.1 IMPACT family member YigZ [Achromobacter anxifer]CAB5513475.1 IMPACT family member YigZ [Achromobacter anxifer]
MPVMHTLTAPCTYQEDIKKSRFVAYAAPVSGVDEAMQFFARHSDPEATHNCWAYRIGQEYRFNDDGEPGGTAGRPILQAIEGQDMDRVAVLVVRWYGGIKLGAGGLVRAYGGCAANCLRLGERTEIVDLATVVCACGFGELALLKSRLAQAGAAILQEDFNEEGVALRFAVPRAAVADLEVTAANITRGRANWEVVS